MNKNYLMKVKIAFKGKNEKLSYFLEEYISEQVDSPWGNSDIQVHDTGATYTTIDLNWNYSNFITCEEDYNCVSQRLDTLKRCGIIHWFSVVHNSVELISYQKEPVLHALDLA